VFGLARGLDGRDEIRLELHAAVNGESAPDGTILRDGDEVTLIPAIQGGEESV